MMIYFHSVTEVDFTSESYSAPQKQGLLKTNLDAEVDRSFILVFLTVNKRKTQYPARNDNMPVLLIILLLLSINLDTVIQKKQQK